MNRLQASHPSDGDLLRYADGEASNRVKDMESHLAACWKCRTELAELQRTIGDCVRYRESVLHNYLPEPPAPWFDIHRHFTELDEAEQRRRWPARVRKVLHGTFAPPRHWATAVALILIVVIVVDHLRNAPSARAAELLEKATAAEGSRPATPRRIRIRTGTESATRVIGKTAAGASSRVAMSPEGLQMRSALQPLFRRANYSWEDPLSAASFAAWRSTLAEKQDEVTTVHDPRTPEQKQYRIRTTTDSSELVQATLQLTVADLRAVAGTFRFRGHENVEMTEIEAVPARPTPVEAAASAPPPSPSPKPLAAPPMEVVEPATPAEELKVLAALHRLGADLGEPVEVSRSGGRVIVSGVGVGRDLGEKIENELTGLPRVEVRLSDPSRGPLPPAERALRDVSPPPEIARLQAEMERELGGRAAYEDFVDEVLQLSDALMSRMHALRRLSERFQPEAESQLSDRDRRLLSDLRRDHAVALAGLATTLEERARPILVSLGAAVPVSTLGPADGSWQGATADLLREARRAEALLAAMLGGAVTETAVEDLPGEALLSLAKLRAGAAAYVRNTLE